MKRGLMITQDISARSEGFDLNGGIDQQALRQYLLFWDRLSCPQSNIIYSGLGADFDFLINAGIADYKTVNFFGSINVNNEFFSELENRALQALSVDKDTDWCLASSFKLLEKQAIASKKDEAISVHLLDAMNVFTPEVPLSEILEFKEKRSDELLEFRDSMDDLKSAILLSADSDEMLRRKIRKIERDIGDVNRLVKESRQPSVKRCATEVLTFTGGVEWVSTSLTSMGLLEGFEMFTKGVGLAGGIYLSLNKLNSSIKLPCHLRQYAYIAHSQTEIK
ncbi:hypothetical protein Shal_3957 [Shewanella halifaxensis HAW-EB4]|uniref:Uncharacterized protein n=1 Tax=Shewanella halifaxensis (strain HAW-EB4) TaxID=458817 RepID=B0TJS9_SHEHH|nr:DUF6236 family protein [Shewanella halifaxensis]ABZ78497.1 hypothetical protein Shal_3957 [Shewanella halifaxensis HAW-EB4]